MDSLANNTKEPDAMTALNDACCPKMCAQLAWKCDKHRMPEDCPDALVQFAASSSEYGLYVHDGGSAVVGISFCPWCGTKLTAK